MSTIEDAIAATLKVYKDASVPRLLSEPGSYAGIKFRKSGCYALDWLCADHSSQGGLPRGRIIEIYGPEGCGKTTIATIACAMVQGYKKKNKAFYIDFEHKFNPVYAAELGLNAELTYYTQPSGSNSGEAGLKYMIESINADDCGIIVMDSVTAVAAAAELAGELTEAHIAAAARIWAKAIRTVAANLKPQSATIICINGIRDNVGVMFGSSERVPGAKAIRANATIRIDVRGQEKIKDGDDVIGQRIKLKAVKNQAGNPFKVVETDLIFGEGFDNMGFVVDLAEELGVVEKVKADKKTKTKAGTRIFGMDELLNKDQLTEYLSDENNLQALYDKCIQKNLKNQEKASVEQGSSEEPKESPEEKLERLEKEDRDSEKARDLKEVPEQEEAAQQRDAGDEEEY